jgi:hypothetical protein
LPRQGCRELRITDTQSPKAHHRRLVSHLRHGVATSLVSDDTEEVHRFKSCTAHQVTAVCPKAAPPVSPLQRTAPMLPASTRQAPRRCGSS